MHQNKHLSVFPPDFSVFNQFCSKRWCSAVIFHYFLSLFYFLLDYLWDLIAGKHQEEAEAPSIIILPLAPFWMREFGRFPAVLTLASASCGGFNMQTSRDEVRIWNLPDSRDGNGNTRAVGATAPPTGRHHRASLDISGFSSIIPSSKSNPFASTRTQMSVIVSGAARCEDPVT